MPGPQDDDDSTGGRVSRLKRWRQNIFDRRGGNDGPDEGSADHAAEEAADAAHYQAIADRAATVAATAAQLERDDAERAAAAEAERESAAQAERNAAAQSERESAEEAEAAEQAQRDAAAQAERDAAERAERDAAERADRASVEQAQRDAAAQAERDAAAQAEREDSAQAEREAATQAAEREAAEQATTEQATTEQAEPSATEPESATPAPRSTTQTGPLPERPAGPLRHETVFEPWNGGWRGGRIVLDKLDVTTNRRLVNAALIEGINAEGPIHIERLARLIAAAFEVRKLSPSRISDIEAMIPRSAVTTEDGSICWPARVDPLQWDGFRSSPDLELRPTEHIARRELANAMIGVLDAVGPLPTSDLFGLTRRVFGGKRVTEKVQARMTDALDEAVTQGRLQRTGDTVSV